MLADFIDCPSVYSSDHMKLNASAAGFPDNFGLFTEIAVCKLLRGWRSYGPKPFLFCPLYVFIHFSAAFCTAHCALDLARDHAP